MKQQYLLLLFMSIIITVIVNIFLYTLTTVLPFIIYRYAIKKTTIEHKKAIRILVIYAICFYVIICILKAISGIVGSPFSIYDLAGFAIDYRLLTGKWYKRKKQKFMEHSALFPDMDDHPSAD